MSRAPQVDESLDSRLLHNFHRVGTSKYGLLAFSNDAKLLAAESSVPGIMESDTHIKIWEMGTGRLLNRLAFTGSYVTPGIVMAFSPDSTHFAAARLDGTVEVWNIDSETSLWVKNASSESRASEISALAFSEDSGTVTLTNEYLSAYQRTTWSVASGECLDSSVGAAIRAGCHNSIALGASPERVVLASFQKNLEEGRTPSIELDIWSVHRSAYVQTTTLTDIGRKGAFSRDLRLFAASSGKELCRVWGVEDGECLCELSEVSCDAIAFSPDSRFLMTASDPGDVHVWALPSGVLSRTFTIAPRGDSMYQSSTYMAIAPDLSLVASAQQIDVRVWSTPHGTIPETKSRKISHSRMAVLPPAMISADSNLVSLVLDDGTRLDLQRTDRDNGTRTTLSRADNQGKGNFSCPISPNSIYVADTLHESVISVRLIDTTGANSVVCSFRGNPPVAFSADSSRIASFTKHEGVCIYDVRNGKTLLCFRLREEKVDAMAWSKDSKMVAVACLSRILIFSTESGACLGDLETGLASSRLKPIVSVAFSHDSLLLAAITNEPVCGIYSVETGKCLDERKVKHHRRHIKQVGETVKFWPDGRLLTRHQAFKYKAESKLLKEATFPQLGLTKDREWVTWDGNDLLWIPMDYRNRIGPTSEEVMLFLSLAEDLEFIRFVPDELRSRYVNGVNGL